MLGVGAITSLAYALTTSFDSSDSSDVDAESKEALTNFERFGADHFLTDFSSKRSFDGFVANNKMPRDKKNRRRRRRRRSNTEGSTKSGNSRQLLKMTNFLKTQI